MSTDTMHVLIIGAGPTGLLIAQGLRKSGISCTVFEKAEHERKRDWAVTLHWSMQTVKSILPTSLAEKLEEAQTNRWEDVPAEKEGIFIRNGSTGEPHMFIPFPGTREMNVQKMKKLFSEGIEIQNAKALLDIKSPHGESYIEAIFADGTRYRGTTLIGSDGGGSTVRRLAMNSALSSEPKDLPYSMMNVYATYDAEFARILKEQLHPIIDIGIHPKGMYCRVNVLDIPDPACPETWKFQVLATWPFQDDEDMANPTEHRLQRLKAHLSDWAEPHESAVAQTIVPLDKLRQWRPRKWDNFDGRLTLAGDAAHTSTFHRGQGMNNAVADAAHYVRALTAVRFGKSKLSDAITTYDEEVIARGAVEVDVSHRQTEETHNWQDFISHPPNTEPSSESAIAN